MSGQVPQPSPSRAHSGHTPPAVAAGKRGGCPPSRGPRAGRGLRPPPRDDTGRGKEIVRGVARTIRRDRHGPPADPHADPEQLEPQITQGGSHLAAKSQSTKYQTQAQQPEQAHLASVVGCLGCNVATVGQDSPASRPLSASRDSKLRTSLVETVSLPTPGHRTGRRVFGILGFIMRRLRAFRQLKRFRRKPARAQERAPK